MDTQQPGVAAPPAVLPAQLPAGMETQRSAGDSTAPPRRKSIFARTGQVVLLLLLAAIVVLTVYGLFRLIRPHWEAVLFYTYLLCGLFVCVVGYFSFRKMLKAQQRPSDEIADALNKARSQKTLSRIRRSIANLLEWLSAVFVWPVLLVWGARIGKAVGSRVRDAVAYSRANGWQPQMALYTATLLLAAVILSREGQAGGYDVALIYAGAITVLVRNLRYAVDETSLPERLRLEARYPYVAFIVVLLCDLTSLVLAAATMISRDDPAQVGLISMQEAVKGLFTFRNLIDPSAITQLSLRQVAVSVAGLIFYVALIGTAIRFKEFRRTDQDYASLAIINCHLAHFDVAADYLRKVVNQSKESAIAGVVASLGVNQIATAAANVKAFRQYQNEPALEPDAHQVMLECCMIFPIPRHVALEVVRRAIAAGVPDGMLQDSIGLLALAAKVQNDELAGLLANRVSDYPITCAAVAIVGERYAEARLLLESAKPASALDEIVRLTMLLRAQVSDPATDLNEDGKTCRLWAERDLPTIKSLVDDLTDGRERVVLYAQLSFAQFASHHLAPEREQEIRYLCSSLKAKAVGDPLALTAMRAQDVRMAALG
jgi:hypothetical protein